MPWREMGCTLKNGIGIFLLITLLAVVSTRSVFAQIETMTVNIPPQELSTALTALADQTSLQVLYASELASDKMSKGIVGTYTPQDVMRQMLEDTGLAFTFTDAKTVTLQKAPVPVEVSQAEAFNLSESSAKQKPVKVPEIVVKDVRQRDNDTQSYVAEEASTATRTDTPLIQVPQSVGVVTQRVIEDQRAIRMEQALRNVSGVAIVQSNEGGADNDKLLCRGFPCAFFKNNLRNEDQNQVLIFRDVANVQRLEVLKGPASVLYGRSEPGGIINIVTKQPLPDRYASITQIVGSFNYYRTMVDVTGPLNESKTLLFRINGAFEDRESYRDFVQGQRYFIAPVFTWKASDKTTFTLEGEYIQDKTTFDTGLPALGQGIAQVPRSRFLGEPYSQTKGKEGRVSLLMVHRFNEAWRIESQFRADESRIDGKAVFSDGLQADNRTLNRSYRALIPDLSSYYWRNDVIGKVATGSIKHELLSGVEVGRQSASLGFGFAPLNSIDIFNPVYNQFPDPNVPALPFSRMFANAVGVYVQDKVAVLDNLHILVGARGDYFYQSSTAGTDTTKAENVGFSPRIGVSYQPMSLVSLYANVTRSFQPTFSVFAPVSNVFKPTTATQYEAGIKAELVPGRLTSTLAVYRILKSDVPVTDPTNPFLLVQTGAQRSQGAEFDITAQVLPGWKVIATYAYTDARVTADTVIQIGNRLPLVARHTGSLWSTYDFQSGPLQGFGVGGGLFAVGERAGDINNSFELPGYVRTDAALYYRKPEVFGHTNLIAQLNFQNLLGQEYFYGGFQTRATAALPGAPLTVLGSVKLEFN